MGDSVVIALMLNKTEHYTFTKRNFRIVVTQSTNCCIYCIKISGTTATTADAFRGLDQTQTAWFRHRSA